jgi:NitT/TauT family transport system permease protein
MKKYPAIVLALFVVGCFWALGAALAAKVFFPGPLAVLPAMRRLASSGVLARHAGASLFRITGALVTGFFSATALGIAAGRSPVLNRLLSPLIYLLHPLPKAAFLPVIMLVLGLGEAAKVFLLGFIIFGQVLVGVRDAAIRTPPELIDSVRSLGAGSAGLLRHVIFPAMLPELFTSLRISLGTALAVLFFTETFATNSGLGYLIMDAWTRLSYPEMYAGILAISFLGLAFFALVDAAEFLTCPWNRQSAYL